MTRYVVLYLGAIVGANLLVATFGPTWSIVNAFLFIGLDLTCRDKLHDGWQGRWLVPRMAGLIALGGVISYLLNVGAGQIALASTVAFTVAATLDGITYALLGDRARMIRVNGSNVVGAAADSLIFPTLAFGVLLPVIVLGQFTAKVLGGFVWSLVLMRPNRRQDTVGKCYPRQATPLDIHFRECDTLSCLSRGCTHHGPLA